MRIATWNLQRGGSRRARVEQQAVLRDINPDVAVLTEPGPGYEDGRGTLISPAERPRAIGPEPWVAIVGHRLESVELEIPYRRLAAAALVSTDGGAFIVYGAVLPWLAVTAHAPELVLPGETAGDAFRRVLFEQAFDVSELRKRYGLPIIWAGDFNQSLVGPISGCSAAGRAVLTQALSEGGFVAWNATAAHARPGLCAVDLICGTRDVSPKVVERIDPMCNGFPLSDHAGYWVEL